MAEFALLDSELSLLAGSLSEPLSLMGDDLLEKLAIEIPDMRTRVGVPEQVVYGGQGLTITKLQLQVGPQ